MRWNLSITLITKTIFAIKLKIIHLCKQKNGNFSRLHTLSPLPIEDNYSVHIFYVLKSCFLRLSDEIGVSSFFLAKQVQINGRS